MFRLGKKEEAPLIRLRPQGHRKRGGDRTWAHKLPAQSRQSCHTPSKYLESRFRERRQKTEAKASWYIATLCSSLALSH